MASASEYDGVFYEPGTFISMSALPGDYTYLTTDTTMLIHSAYSLQPIKIAVLNSAVKDSRGQDVSWEGVYFDSLSRLYLGGNYFDSVDASGISAGALNGYNMLIIPTVTKGYVDAVVSEIGATGLSELRNFVQGGGTLYAQGDSTYIAEVAGLVSPGTVLLDQRVTAVRNTGVLSVRKHGSPIESWTPDSPLEYSWTSNQMYVLDDPLLHASDAKQVIAEYSDGLLDPAQLGTPAIMASDVGYGEVVLISGHPSERIDCFPILLDVILSAMAERASLSNEIRQTYSANLPSYMIPALEANVTMEVTGILVNFWNATIKGVSITDWIRKGFVVDEATIHPAPDEVRHASDGTWINWTFDTPQGESQYGYVVKTCEGTVQTKWTHVAGSWARYQDPITGSPVRIVRDSLWVYAAMRAQLLGDRDIELDGIYPLPAEGAYFDMAFPLENKEETDALETTIVDIVPLKSPVVDVVDQTRIPDALNNSNFGTNNPVYANITIFFYDNPNYPLPDGVADSHVMFTVQDADTTYAYNASGVPIVLPAKKLTWTIGTIRAYDYKEPMVRYGLFVQEEYQRTVSFISDPVPGSVVLNASGGSVYTALGSHCVPYHEYLQYAIVYMPEYPEPPRADYKDVWERNHSLDLRTTFFDIVPYPPAEEHAVSTKTFEVLVDGKRTLEYPMDKDAQLHYVIKSWNSYPPYDPVNYPYHMDMVRNETLVREAIPKGVGYTITYDHSVFGSRTELADVVETDTQTILYFRQDLNASEKQVVDVYANMRTTDHEEGAMKVNDGTRFVYRQIAVGPSRYEVLDNHVQAVFGLRNDLDLSNSIAPVSVNTYGDDVYQILKVTEPSEPQELQDPYIKSYGFGNASATTYVGGRVEKTLLYSKLQPMEKTLVRIEVSDNLGYDLTNVKVIPDAPPCLTVEPAVFAIPPIWYDFPFLNVFNIWDAWKGVYYFWVTAGPEGTGGQDVERGRIYQVNFTLQGGNVPQDFQIPPALIGIKDLAGHVKMTYGAATDIKVEQDVPSYVNVTDARIADEAEKADIEYHLAINDKAGVEMLFNALRTVGVVKSLAGNTVNLQYQLPSYAQTIPWSDNGQESFTFYVVTQSSVMASRSGANLYSQSPKVTYVDHFGRLKADWGSPQWVYAHGPAVILQPRVDEVIADGKKQDFLTAGVLNVIHATIYVPNTGDDIAQNVIVTAEIPQGIAFQTSSPAPESAVGTSYRWSLGDIAPYSQSSITLTLFTIAPIPTFSPEPFTLIETMQPEFMHMYLQKQVKCELLGPPALNALNVIDAFPPGTPRLDQIQSPTNVPATPVSGRTEPRATVNVVDNGVFAGSGAADADGRFTIWIMLTEGSNEIAARSTDTFGNGPSAPSLPQTVILDTTAPSAPILDGIPTLVSTPTITVGGSSEPSSTVEISVFGSASQDSYVVTAESHGLFSAEVTLTEGLNVIMARATDALGNGPGEYSVPQVVELDSTSPVALIDMVSPSPSALGHAVTFTGSGHDKNPIVAYSWRSSLDGHLSDLPSFSTSSLSLGIHVISFKVQDSVGLWSPEETVTLTVGANLVPRANAGPDIVAAAGGVVELDGHVTNADSRITYEWDFTGDGVYEWRSDSSGRALFRYENPGTYHAILRVTDTDGDVGTDECVVTVQSVSTGTAGGENWTSVIVLLLSVVLAILVVMAVVIALVSRRRTREAQRKKQLSKPHVVKTGKTGR